MYKNILVAYDGSILSWKAIEAAKFQASLNEEAEVHIITVLEAEDAENEAEREKITQELEAKFLPQMKKIEEEFKKNNIEATMEIVVSEENINPGVEIAKYAKDHNNDLIVMGSRGLGNSDEIILGSVSNEVVQKAKCPVLVIKEKK